LLSRLLFTLLGEHRCFFYAPRLVRRTPRFLSLASRFFFGTTARLFLSASFGLLYLTAAHIAFLRKPHLLGFFAFALRFFALALGSLFAAADLFFAPPVFFVAFAVFLFAPAHLGFHARLGLSFYARLRFCFDARAEPHFFGKPLTLLRFHALALGFCSCPLAFFCCPAVADAFSFRFGLPLQPNPLLCFEARAFLRFPAQRLFGFSARALLFCFSARFHFATRLFFNLAANPLFGGFSNALFFFGEPLLLSRFLFGQALAFELGLFFGQRGLFYRAAAGGFLFTFETPRLFSLRFER
jgi:hypothetical protein